MIQRSLKQVFSYLLCFFLVLSSLWVLSPITTSADEGHDVTIQIGQGNGTGTVRYRVNGNGDDEWTTVTGNSATISGSTLNNGDTIQVQANPASGFCIDSHENQNIDRYNDSDHDIYSQISAGPYTFTYTNIAHTITIKFDNSQSGGNNGGNNGGGGGLQAGQYEIQVDKQNNTTGTVVVDFLNSSQVSLGNAISTSNNIPATAIPEGAAYVKVSMADAASASVLNNARIERFPRPDNGFDEIDIIDEIRRENAPYSITAIDRANKGYQIKITFSNTMSVSWSYDRATAAPDQLVENARIELLNSDNPTDYADYGRHDWQLENDHLYYFVLIPDYGYQVSSLNINGQEIAPQNSIGVFAFRMSHSNFHFQGIVTPTSNITSFDNNGILGGLSVDAAEAINSGNVRLTERDVAPDSNSLASVNSSEASLFGTVDLSMDQIISKGNGEYWETEKTDLPAPATISMVVPAGELADGQTYTVVREHNGVYEELDAVFYLGDSTLQFTSDKFSTFSIIKKPGTPNAGSSTGSGGSSSSSSSSDEHPIPSLSDSIGGVAVTNWTEFDNVITTNPGAVDKRLVELVLNYQNTTVPADVFKNASNTNAVGIHLFVGNGCALSFMNGGRIADQPAVDLSCTTTEENGKKAVVFNSYADLIAPVIYHNIVPAGTKSVRVYFTGSDGVRTLLSTITPTDAGRFCFAISKLGIFEMEYDPV
jgi:hypothetical protein